jgi:hypothetical protein
VPDIGITVRGPLFDGQAAHVVRDFLDDATWEVGSQGLADVHRLLDASIRHPTPYYETQLTVQRIDQGVSVNDRGVVYGNWLEGTGSRNRTTRFKGYYSFRRATQELEQKVPVLVEPILRRHLSRLG